MNILKRTGIAASLFLAAFAFAGEPGVINQSVESLAGETVELAS